MLLLMQSLQFNSLSLTTPNVFHKLCALTLTRVQNSAALFSSLNFNNSDFFIYLRRYEQKQQAKPVKPLNNVTFSLHLSFSFSPPFMNISCCFCKCNMGTVKCTSLLLHKIFQGFSVVVHRLII